MSQLQQQTARLIARTQALLDQARQDVRHTRRLLDHAGFDPLASRESAERRLGPNGKQVFEELLNQRLAEIEARARVASPDGPPPDQGPARRTKAPVRYV